MAVVDAPLHRDDGILMVRRNVGGQYRNGLNNQLNSCSGSGMSERIDARPEWWIMNYSYHTYHEWVSNAGVLARMTVLFFLEMYL